MIDARKLHEIVLGKHVQSKYNSKDFRDPDSIDEAYRLWVHRCVSINASVAASVPIKLVRHAGTKDERRRLDRTGNIRPLSIETKRLLAGNAEVRAPYSFSKASSRYRIDDMIEVDSHALLDLLASANRWMDGYALTEAMISDMQLSGEAFLYGPSNGEPPTELWRMMPYYVTPIPDPVDFVSGFTYRNGADTRRFTPDEVTWVRRFNPTNPYRGTSELEAWSLYSDASKHIAEFNAWLMRRNGAPDYVVTDVEGMSEPEKRAFRTQWKALFGRMFNRSETIAFMTRGKLEKLTQTNRELEFTESSRLVRDFVAAGFGVPKALLTPEDANRAVTREANDQHLRLTVWPLVCRYYDALNDQLASRFGQGLMIVPENPIRQDAADRAAERSSRLAAGASVDELRSEDGMPEWGTPESSAPLIGAGLRRLDRMGQSEAPSMFSGPVPADPPPADEPEQDDPDEPGQPPKALRATCLPRGAPPIASVSELIVPPMPRGWAPPDDDHVAAGKAVGDASGDDVDALVRAMRPVMAGLRSTLDTLAQAAGWGDGGVPASIFGDDRLAAAVVEARRALAAPITSIIAESGQNAINRVTPGMGLVFRASDPAVKEFIDASADRIGRTMVGTYETQVRRLLVDAEATGVGLANAARGIAASSRVDRWVADRLAKTEAQFAVTYSKSEAWGQSAVVRGKRFVLSADPCELCQSAADAAGDTVFDSRSAVFPSGTMLRAGTRADGEPQMVTLDYLESGLLGPPVHPNCRCRIEPVLAGE